MIACFPPFFLPCLYYTSFLLSVSSLFLPSWFSLPLLPFITIFIIYLISFFPAFIIFHIYPLSMPLLPFLSSFPPSLASYYLPSFLAFTIHLVFLLCFLFSPPCSFTPLFLFSCSVYSHYLPPPRSTHILPRFFLSFLFSFWYKQKINHSVVKSPAPFPCCNAAVRSFRCFVSLSVDSLLGSESKVPSHLHHRNTK